ncbi:MAG: lycopene cyclase domain-containing protein, partial [Verrucomicrobiia bacterium]
WDFPNDRLLGRLGHLPYEEIAFFLIQSLLVILLLGLCLPEEGRPTLKPVDFTLPTTALPAALGLLLWILIGLGFGRRAWARPRLHYAWHLLYWFLPLILLQWAFAWPILLPRWDLIALPALVLGTWLTFADWIAVRQGIWYFDPAQITGHTLARILPWEEIAFFYLTSILVAQSYLILLPESLR